jgi:hypothetical protein
MLKYYYEIVNLVDPFFFDFSTSLKGIYPIVSPSTIVLNFLGAGGQIDCSDCLTKGSFISAGSELDVSLRFLDGCLLVIWLLRPA